MYNKLFTKILDSSIWLESTPTRIVWLTFIAVMDENGFAQFASAANVAHRARVSPDEASAAIATLESPDTDSSDPENEGRRLERVPGGWMILNADKHRKLVTKAVIQEQTRLRVAKHREQKRNAKETLGNGAPLNVTPSEAGAVAEARSEARSEDLRSNNKLGTSSSAHTTSGNDPPSTTARSKRPIFTGQRLTVFEWMLDDCTKTLGPLTDAFNLHAWFFALDAEIVKTAIVIPKRDGGAWFQAALLIEAQRRGLPIAVATPPPSKRTAQLAHAVATIAREEAEKRAAQK